MKKQPIKFSEYPLIVPNAKKLSKADKKHKPQKEVYQCQGGKKNEFQNSPRYVYVNA